MCGCGARYKRLQWLLDFLAPVTSCATKVSPQNYASHLLERPTLARRETVSCAMGSWSVLCISRNVACLGPWMVWRADHWTVPPTLSTIVFCFYFLLLVLQCCCTSSHPLDEYAWELTRLVLGCVRLHLSLCCNSFGFLTSSKLALRNCTNTWIRGSMHGSSLCLGICTSWA